MIRLAVAAGFALSIGGVPTAQAKVLLAEQYEKAEPTKVGKIGGSETRHGRGWRPRFSGNNLKADEVDLVRLPLAGLIDGTRGTVEMDLVRGEISPRGKSDALFALVSADNDTVFAVRIDWDGDVLHGGQPVLAAEELWYTETRNPGRLQPGTYIGSVPLNKRIGVGTAFNVSFTWGPSPSDCNIYLDGRKLNAIVAKPFRMQEFVESAVEIVFGGQPSPSAPLVYDQASSLFKSVYIYDEPIDGAALYANPEQYRLSGVGPVVASVSHDAARVAGFSSKLVAGNTMTVTVQGTPGAVGTFDIVHYPDMGRKIPLDWRGWGVYLEDKVFYDEGEVNLRDVTGYRVYARTGYFDPLAPGFDPVEELKVEEQTYLLEDLEIDTPYYVAVVAVMRDGTLRPVISPVVRQRLAEGAPGVYSGLWQVGFQDRYPRAVAVGRLRVGEQVERLAGTEAFIVDPALSVAVATVPDVLKADETSTAKVTVTVTDANGNPVRGHKVKFVLATTSQYTGVVGGGAFKEQVGGSLKEDAWGETDLFGRLTTTYVAGFAAKTAVIVARDMASNSTGAGYIKTFIQSTAELELLPVETIAAMSAGYAITVTSSDKWLTADGKSQARITAEVTLDGKPVEGRRIGFSVSAGSGSIRAVSDTTDRSGKARAVFTAGRKIGIALVTARDAAAGISGSVAIELRSDAPAKIAINLDPAQLPADGSSRAELTVLVTDINDNPNEAAEVEYAIASGDGRLRNDKGLTDRRGENANTFTAGRSPGKVSIEITVRSATPTQEEIDAARGFAVAVTDYKFF